MAHPSPPQSLTPQEKAKWNDFVDFLQKTGYKGSTALDNRTMTLGKNLLNRYNQNNPKNPINYEDIARIQQEIHNQRAETVAMYHKNPGAFVGVNNENDIMRGISPVDGWLGSKTSSHKFPVAALVTDINGKRDTTNFGTDMNAMEKTAQNLKPAGK